MRVDGDIASPESKDSLRLVSFNINGYKTLNHYHPWNELDNLCNVFEFLKADIITFQELKLQKSDIDRSLGIIPGYTSFITLPSLKKGYSGVSVFVKNNRIDGVRVIKAEEGLTGYLDVSNLPGLNYRKVWDRDGKDGISIGGYTHNLRDWKEALSIDSEGRCIIIELNNGIVIFSLYCPANSMGDDEEEMKRCLFLETLLDRARNLEEMGKHVIIMGDINVAPSLMDRDDLIDIGLKEGHIRMPKEGEKFEIINKKSVLEFRNGKPGRIILNKFLYDINELTSNFGKNLYDLGRIMNPDRLKMYTCWNTLKNNRPMNIGSRIDLFLGTSKIKESCQKCDIWTFLYGSDHCPIYLDIDLSQFEVDTEFSAKTKHFEASSYYKLGGIKRIDTFFKSTKTNNNKETNNSQDTATATKSELSPHQSANSVQKTITNEKSSTVSPVYQSRKKPKLQTTLADMFKIKTKEQEKQLQSSLFVSSDDEEENQIKEDFTALVAVATKASSKRSLSVTSFSQILDKASTSTPNCNHNEPCILRTTRTGSNAGRRFWCCSKPKENSTWKTNEDSNNTETDSTVYSCQYFKWASK